jgi:predicted ester cyclase
MAPMGKQVTASAINIYRISKGNLVEKWSGSRRSSVSLVEQLKG